jgi:pimeloyl-ACP methyl ester carboxylesterase
VTIPTGETSAPLRIGGVVVHHRVPAAPGGVPVLFIHGILAGGWMFERWLDAFAARGHPAYALDLRGHGDTPPGGAFGKVGLADYVDDATAVARWIESTAGTPALVGHSMGGLIAQKLAEGGLASALVLIGTAPPRGITLLTPLLLRTMARYTGALLFSRPLVPRLSDLEPLSLNAVSPEQRPGLLSRFGAESGRASRQLALGGLAVDAAAVRCPVLVVSGDEDRFVPLKAARAVAGRYGAELVVLRGHGHLPMWEPESGALAARLADWIESSRAAPRVRA